MARDACDYAYRAVISFEAEGEGERAYFWFLLLVMLGDIASHRIDPGRGHHHSLTLAARLRTACARRMR